MTSSHIDQLDKWYEEAEKGTPRVGDLFISPYPSGVGYEVGVMDEDGLPGNMLLATRILARAPKPKPAWHDAVAVTATATDDLGDEITAVWVREGDELWRSDEGGRVLREDLRDVTPLIEAKVTGAMTVAAISAYRGIDRSALSEFTRDEVEDMRRALAAALGLETE